jgi:hypothetical protein
MEITPNKECAGNSEKMSIWISLKITGKERGDKAIKNV